MRLGCGFCPPPRRKRKTRDQIGQKGVSVEDTLSLSVCLQMAHGARLSHQSRRNARRARPAAHYAARFAAKEAFSKALGTGIKGFSLTEIEIREDDNGKPYFVLSGRAAKLAEGLSLHLSMSHEREEAVAMVVAEYEK